MSFFIVSSYRFDNMVYGRCVHLTWVLCLGQEDALEEEIATCSSILARKIPWTEEPDGLQSKGSQRVGHD